MFAKKIVLGLFLGAAVLTQTACSGGVGGFVNGVKLETTEENGVEFIELSTTLNTQGLMLTGMTVPILDPKNPTQIIGQVAIRGMIGVAQSELAIMIRSDVLPSLPNGGKGVLPNGTAIPVAGVNAKKWISIPLTSSSKIYLNLDLETKTAVLGAAIGIPALALGTTANVLMPFNSGGLSGLAGIYTGVKPGQSGFAFFVNASSILGQLPTLPGVSSKASRSMASVESKINFVEMASNEDMIRVHRRVLQLKEAGTRLRAQ